MASMKSSTVVLVLLVSFLFIASEEMVGVDAQTWCSSPSGRYQGACFRNANCANVCAGEGWPSGICDSFRCMCRRPCEH